MNRSKPNRPARSLAATISGVVSLALVVGAPTVLALSVAAPASAAECSPTAKATSSISSLSPAHTVLDADARIIDIKHGRSATARAKVKVRGTVVGSFSATATVDACPGGMSNPVKHTMSVQASRSASDAATETRTSTRSPLKKTARKKAVRAATGPARRGALTSAESKVRSDGAAQAEQTAIETARAMSKAGGVQAVEQPTVDRISAEIVRLTNHHRSADGAQAVTSMAPLRAYGDNWAATLIAQQRVYHSNSGNGPTPGMFPELVNCTTAQRTAEIATGFHLLDPNQSVDQQAVTAAAAAVNAFATSSAHRAYLLDPQATRIGAGVAIGKDSLGRPAIAVVSIMFRGDCPQVA